MLSFKRFYIVVLLLLFITFSAIYFSSLNNSHRIFPEKLTNIENNTLLKLIEKSSNLFSKNAYSLYKLKLLKNKNVDNQVIEIEESNIHIASLITESDSHLNFKNWIKYKPSEEFRLNTRPYFKINNSDLVGNTYLLISGDTYEHIALKQFDYITFSKTKSAIYLIRIINIMLLLGIILAALYVYLKLRNGYSFFFLFYMVLSLCSSTLYNGFTNDFWPFNLTNMVDNSLAICLGIHLVTLTAFITFYLGNRAIDKKLMMVSITFLLASIVFLIASFFMTSYILLRYEVWFSCLISIMFLMSYSTIFKTYKKKDAYKFNYLSIISYVLLSLIYSIKYFSFFTPNILFELLQKNLFLSHVSCLFFAFILINKKKLLANLIKEDKIELTVSFSDYNENTNELSQLSDREYKVLELISDGLKDQEIADQLFVSITTVKTHKQRIYRKLNINNKFQAAKIYSEFNSKAINF